MPVRVCCSLLNGQTLSGSKLIAFSITELDGDGISTNGTKGSLGHSISTTMAKGFLHTVVARHSLPTAYSDIALVVGLEQLVLGLSEGSLSQWFALDLNISEPSTQYNLPECSEQVCAYLAPNQVLPLLF